MAGVMAEMPMRKNMKSRRADICACVGNDIGSGSVLDTKDGG